MTVALLGASGLPAEPLALTSCLELLQAAPQDRESSRCLVQVVNGGHPELRAAAIEALEALHRQHPGEPWPMYYLAALEWPLRTARVAELYARAAERLEQRRDWDGEASARASRARYLDLIGEADAAAEELVRLRHAAERSAEPSALLRYSLAEASHQVIAGGDLEYALALLERHRSEVEEPSELPERTRSLWLHGVSTVLYELGRFRQVDEILEQLEGLARRSGDVGTEGATAYRRAALLAASRRPSEAVAAQVEELARRSLELTRRTGAVANQAQAHRLLGQLLPGEEGRGHLDRCVELASGLPGGDSLEALCLEALVLSLAAEKEASEELLLGLLERAAEAAERAGDPWSRLFVRQARARTLWLLSDRKAGLEERALEEGLAVLGEIETLRAAQRNKTGRAEFLDVWWEPYQWLAGELLGEGENQPSRENLEHAFAIVERMRGRTLLETLGPEVSALLEPELEPEAGFDGRLEGGFDGDFDGGFADLAAVEAHLEEDEALLSYQVSLWRDLYRRPAGGAWVTVSTRQGTRVYPLPDRREIEPVLERQLGLEHPVATPDHLLQLHHQLLAPVLGELPDGIRRLILIPDGVLHRVPFALLRSTEASESSLVVDYQLSYVPSATLWLRWRTRPVAGAAAPALVLADPLLPAGESTADSQAPTQTPVEAQDGAATLRGRELGPLPYARREGRDILQRLSGGGTGRLLLGAEASESFLKQHPHLAQYSLLHFAAHALVDVLQPSRSALMLAPGDSQEDGRLEPEEIVGLDLSGRLVVLGACDSAAGQVLRGEGTMSLARAFFEAGAHTVVASQRPLPDLETSRLFNAFYQHLAEGFSVGEALAQAQRERLVAGADPRGWGALVVLGDASLVPFPGGLEAAPGRPGAGFSGLGTPGFGLLALGLLALVVCLVLAGLVVVKRLRRRPG
ncbi:MAG: CHAT domain-containing protein [Acidobacteriota bacterium]|nr:CHAT domain-containing protein [Acidobacteriota bacterium]